MRAQLLTLCIACCLFASSECTKAAEVTLIFGEGFDDATEVVPEGGNPGVTVGEQRKIAYQYAANLWGGVLKSDVPINLLAEFGDLFCDSNFASLGFAGPTTVFSLEEVDTVPETWYPSALADALAGRDLASEVNGEGFPDIVSQFNANINGNSECRDGLRWYYGLDGKSPDGTIDFLSVVMHEITHGLGFVSYTDEASNFFLDTPDIYSVFSLDTTLDLHWNEMTLEQRQQSAVNDGNLVWDGVNVTNSAPSVLDKRAVLYARKPQGVGPFANLKQAFYGPEPTRRNFRGEVVLVNDGVDNGADGCEPIIDDLSGKVALIDRGACPFEVKTLNAQNAGASAVIVANTGPGSLPSMFGETTEAVIPSVGMDFAGGEEIKANLPGIKLVFGFDRERLQGANDDGLVRLYAPSNFEPFSSVSHFDTNVFPEALMEPFIVDGLLGDSSVDLTPALLADIGWPLTEGSAELGSCSTQVEVVSDNGLIAGSVVQANNELCLADSDNVSQYARCMGAFTIGMVIKGAIKPKDFTDALSCGVKQYGYEF